MAKWPWQAYITVKRVCAGKNKLSCWIWLLCWPTIWQITVLPQVLNTLSAGVLVAGIQGYILANWQTVELTSRSFHRRGPVSLSAGGVCKELFSSALIAPVTHSPKSAIIYFLSWKRLQRFSPLLICASATAALCIDPEGAVTLFSESRVTLTLCTECWSINQNIGVTCKSSSISAVVYSSLCSPVLS